MKKTITLFLFCLPLFLAAQETGRLFSKQEEVKIPEQIVTVSQFFERIKKGNTFSIADEIVFFGNARNLLGESIYQSLKMGEYDSNGRFVLSSRGKNDESLLCKLLAKKLFPLLKNKMNIEYTIATSVYYQNASDLIRITDHDGITVSARVVGPEVPFWSSGTTFLFKFVPNEDRSKWYINLISSSVGNTPFHEFLGFKGKYPSDFKLSDGDLKSLLKDFPEER